MLRGSFVALVTPFKDGKVNYSIINDLIQFHLDQKTDGFVPCGTTGESPALTEDEHYQIVETVVKSAKGKVPIIAGSGTNNTEKTVRQTLRVKDLGADYGLVITPYYNKPTQEGLYRHFSYVADQVKFPILIYNVPSRTGVNIQPETVERLAKNSNIVGIKEASGNLVQVSEIIKRCGEKFIVLSGEDGLTLPLLSLGATGVISVTANVVPRETHEMIMAYLQGETHQALQIHLKLLELAQILFVETSPGPVKAALQMIGFEVGAPRLPLAEVTDGTRQKIRKVISDLGYLKN